MSRYIAFAFALLATLSLIYATGCKDKGNESADGGGVDSSKEIPIGVFLSLSGPTESFGLSTKYGVELAVEEINKAGGVLGKPMKIYEKNIQLKKEEAQVSAESLSTKEKVLVAIGAVESSMSNTAAPIFQKHGVPMISPSSTNPTVTQNGDMIFRVCFTDDFQGKACAFYATQELKAKRAALLVNRDDDYSTGLANAFKAVFQKMGGKILAEEFYNDQNKKDFASQVSNIAKSSEKPEVVFIPGYYEEVPLAAKELRKQGVDCKILGGDGWESPDLLPGAGASLEGCYFGIHYDPDSSDAVTQRFVKGYKAKWGAEKERYLNSLAALGYDAVYVARAAIEKAGVADRAKVAEALRGTKDFAGASGTFSIDGNRNARKSIYLVKIEGTKWKLSRKVTPDELDK